ncbi:hypothetical protein PN498_25485 [Oscillatoria sp. CS-180]|uniref:hypothetical protein n=1 Tax=Oscillatoria sp. CS-180 TaxID=3021720 RepID=UPI00232DF00E|nr:hypothetical protein [Oscillatoria sp. CS-180]MDB9529369.1 hypothetical protein [Oscillatoria sp. CS-180]
MVQSWIDEFQGSEWNGRAELWIDPAGNEADMSESTLSIGSEILSYTWAYEGETKTGAFTFHDSGATWTDSWHQPEPVQCRYLTNAWGLFTVEYVYPVPSGPDWGWRSKLSQRPDNSLVLQMTNIAPWGEEGRAARMIFQRA